MSSAVPPLLLSVFIFSLFVLLRIFYRIERLRFQGLTYDTLIIAYDTLWVVAFSVYNTLFQENATSLMFNSFGFLRFLFGFMRCCFNLTSITILWIHFDCFDSIRTVFCVVCFIGVWILHAT